MRTRPLREQPETVQETLLRTTLREHAPQTVDLEQGWETVSRRIASLDGKSHLATGLRLVTSGKSRQMRSRKKWPVLVAVAALFVALLGAGVAGPLSRWFAGGGTGIVYAYSDVNQSQQSGGIQIIVGKAYADPERLYLVYEVQLPSDLSKHYSSGFIVDGKTQGRYGPTAQLPGPLSGFCQLTAYAGKPVYCLNEQGPLPGLFHVPPDVNKVVITWDITEVELHSVPWTTHKSSPLLIHGHWHFQFSIPFYHQEHDPAMPFPFSR